MQNKFAVTPSPHLREKATTQRIMQEVCLALAPAGIAAIIHFGAKAAILIAVCVATCVLFEFLWQKIMKQKVTISDWSAVVTGLLLAYNLPSTTPLVIAAIGSLVAIVLVKQMFGGIGSNFMNPALTARVVLFLSWGSIVGNNYPASAFDALSGATPLKVMDAGSTGGIKVMDLLLGNHGGVIGETCALAIILGGLYLLIRGIIDWRIPVFFIGTTFLCFCLNNGAEYALFQVLSGGLLLGAFFMATDYATSPITGVGRIIMGVACGLLVFLMRRPAEAMVEGVSFAILFLNVCTPIIDRFTAPRPFGEVKNHG